MASYITAIYFYPVHKRSVIRNLPGHHPLEIYEYYIYWYLIYYSYTPDNLLILYVVNNSYLNISHDISIFDILIQFKLCPYCITGLVYHNNWYIDIAIVASPAISYTHISVLAWWSCIAKTISSISWHTTM